MKPGRYSSGRTGLARALSKLGYCSRSQAVELIRSGRVKVDRVRRCDPEHPVILTALFEIDGHAVRPEAPVYIMLNKPRGLVTTRSDEKGRATVYETLEGSGLPHVSPVGRLDQASEGMLLFTNDTNWANGITSPHNGIEKTYHVQVDCIASPELLRTMCAGVPADGDVLAAKSATLLRTGERNSWIALVLDEGKNRHIRRLLKALDVEVLRLIRIAIGPLQLGTLAKGQWRYLKESEVQQLRHGRP